jgi:CxxC-x17-CxxC domain-containing protein
MCYSFETMNDQQGDKKMFQGDWTCSGCNGAIKELPFEPRATGNLVCSDCFKKKRDAQVERKTFSGNWTCKDCGGAITELPFEPRETGNLVCRDCYRKSKS